jgi:hypothetical protein
MQYVVTILIVLLAIGYAGWRICQLLHRNDNTCIGCELKKNCKKFGQSK